MELPKAGKLLKLLDEALKRRANNELRADDLTLTQVMVLMELDHAQGEMSMKDLEKQFAVSQPTMAGIVSRLRQKGLVETCEHPDDRRAKMTRITTAGKDCCVGACRQMYKTEKLLLSGFTDEETCLFLDFLERALSNVK